MHDEPLDRESPTATGLDVLDRRVIRALEALPEFEVDGDFAARVAARLPERPLVTVTATYYGRTATLIGIVVLMAAMLVLAAHAAGSVFRDAMEGTLFALFLGLTIWFSSFRRRPN